MNIIKQLKLIKDFIFKRINDCKLEELIGHIEDFRKQIKEKNNGNN